MTYKCITAILVFFTAVTACAQSLRNDAIAMLQTAEKTALYTPDGASPPYHERVSFTVAGNPEMQGRFIKDYLSDKQWRERYELGDFLRVQVRNGSQVGEFRSAAFEPIRTDQVRRSLPPVVIRLASNNGVKKIANKSVDGVDVQCVEYETSGGNIREEDEFCISRTDGTPVRLRQHTMDGPCVFGCGMRETEWSGYVAFGDKRYPKHVVVNYKGHKIIDAVVEVTPGTDLGPSSFEIPKELETRRACNQTTPPVRIKGDPPHYPHRMNEFMFEGTVVVQARIGIDGHVQDAQVADLGFAPKGPTGTYPAPEGREVTEVLTEEIRKWVFEPAKCDGLPTVQNILIPFKTEVRGAGVTRLEL